MVSENAFWHHTPKNTTKHPIRHKTKINKGRPGNKKSPDFTGLFRIYEIVLDYHLAERVGFEPTVHRSAQRFSRPSDSTTLAPLRIFCSNLVDILILIPMIFIRNEHVNLSDKAVNIIKSQSFFSPLFLLKEFTLAPILFFCQAGASAFPCCACLGRWLQSSGEFKTQPVCCEANAKNVEVTPLERSEEVVLPCRRAMITYKLTNEYNESIF